MYVVDYNVICRGIYLLNKNVIFEGMYFVNFKIKLFD